jgi:hypothetical protein
MKDSIVEQVREELLNRSELGIEKYKTTLDREDLCNLDWLQHAKEEAMDLTLYLTRLQKEMLKQNLEMSRLKGEYYGTLRSFLSYKLPYELEHKIKLKIEELETGFVKCNKCGTATQSKYNSYWCKLCKHEM